MFRKSKRWLIVFTIFIGVIGVSAQDSQTADPLADAVFGVINVPDGFVLDPTLLTLIAGGGIPANSLQEDCVGHLSSAPSAVLNLDETDVEMLRLFFFSDDDATLTVVTPSGEILCNDDAGPGLLDPSVDIATPEAGRYAVFVGSYSSGQLVPGFLVITSQDTVGTSTLNLGGLVARALSAANSNEQGIPLPVFDVSKIDLTAEPISGTLDVAAGFDTLSVETSGGGSISAVSLDSVGSICNGNISAAPSVVVTVTEPLPFVRVFFNGMADSTLMILRDDGAYVCSDDSNGQLNPSLEFTGAAPGTYAIYVGSFDVLQIVSGTLVITEDSSVQAEILGSAPLIAPALHGGE
ncbi:MAG: hypothetical protein IAE89_07340 [Anaerolineae bacterium]|nr:hypothetical protein [Anaerolineae bacterium]